MIVRALRHAISRALTLAMAAACAALAPAPAAAQVVTRNVDLLGHVNDYPPTIFSPFGAGYSACWAYVHPDGREYAVIGTNNGTAIYNITDPVHPHSVAFIPGPFSAWREMKSYRTWIYITTEGTDTGAGLQIVRMTNPEAPVLAATYTTGFARSHTVQVDTTRALLICNGTRDVLGYATGMRILSIASPEAPVELSHWPNAYPVGAAQYVHDCEFHGNTLYAAGIYVGTERRFDLTDPANPVLMNSWSYPGAYYTHSAWPESAGRFLYVADEQNGQALRVFDMLDPMNPQLVNTITCNPQAIVHNPRVKGRELYLANYTEGIRVCDLSDPAHPAEFASADSYAGISGGYAGVWEVCPYFPSGTVIASDMQSGLYVYQIQRNYGLVRVRVVDGSSGLPLPGIMVHLSPQGDSLTTPADGIVQFGPSPGIQTVSANPFGYDPAEGSSIVTIGSRDTVTLTLTPRPRVDFTGVVRESGTLAPLADAEVSLDATALHEHTDGAGAFTLPSVPEGTYLVRVARAGYAPLANGRHISAGSASQDYTLTPALSYDALETGAGWTVGASGDAASDGVWMRVTPVGSGPRPPADAAQVFVDEAVAAPSAAPSRGARDAFMDPAAAAPAPLHAQHDAPAATIIPNAAPYADHSPGVGTMCFVTGQGTDSTDVDQADVDGGRTTLLSPAYDVAALGDPVIGYWRWFLSTYVGGTDQPDPEDWLAVGISNDDGASWTAVDTTRAVHNHWEQRTVRVKDFVTPTSKVRLRFQAADFGVNTTVEAAIDDITLWDAASIATGVGPTLPATLRFLPPRPNPGAGEVTLAIELPAPGALEVEVLDLAGRRMRTLRAPAAVAGLVTLRWDGRDERGRSAPPGLYIARARYGGIEARTRFVRIR